MSLAHPPAPAGRTGGKPAPGAATDGGGCVDGNDGDGDGDGDGGGDPNPNSPPTDPSPALDADPVGSGKSVDSSGSHRNGNGDGDGDGDDDSDSPRLHLSTGRTGPNSRLLYSPMDRDYLNDLMCLARSQIEIFVEDDERRLLFAPMYGTGKEKEEAPTGGRVGIRCRWCCGNPPRPSSPSDAGAGKQQRERGGAPPAAPFAKRARGAVYYPTLVRLVYQSVRNWQRHHLLLCPRIPDDIKRDYTALKSRKWTSGGQKRGQQQRQKRSGNRSVQYWEDQCRNMGFVDTGGMGIYVRKGWTFEDVHRAAEAAERSVDVKVRMVDVDIKERGGDGKGGKGKSAASSPSGPNTNRLRKHQKEAQGGTPRCAKSHSSPSALEGIPQKIAAATIPAQVGESLPTSGGDKVATPSSSSGLSRLELRVVRPELRADTMTTLPISEQDGPLLEVSLPERRAIPQQLRQQQPRLLPGSGFAERVIPGAAPVPFCDRPSYESSSESPRPGLDSGTAWLAGLTDLPISDRDRRSPEPSQPGWHNVPEHMQQQLPVPIANGWAGGPSTNLPISEIDRQSSDPARLEQQKVAQHMQRRAELRPDPSPAEGGASSVSVVASAATFSAGLITPSPKGSAALCAMAASPPSAALDPRENDGGGNILSSAQRSAATTALVANSSSAAAAAHQLFLPFEAAVLERVSLAHDLVRTVGELLHMPPSPHPLRPREEEGAGRERSTQPSSGAGEEDLTDIGAELYELFSGRPPFEDASHHGDNNTITEDAFNEDVADSFCDGDAGDGGEGDEQGRKRHGAMNRGHCSSSGGRSGFGNATNTNQTKHSRKYVPLSTLGLPPALCALVSSLLDGDRVYSSAGEVEEDLRLLRTDPRRFLFEPPSTAGTLDVPRDEVYGREEEVRALLKVFDRTSATSSAGKGGGGGGGGVEMVLISGYAGTGKSSIVRSARSILVSRGARFVSGKFDAMRHVQPLSAIVSALDEYCVLLAGSNEAERVAMRDAIRSASGGEERALVDLIPSLGAIVSCSHSPHGDDSGGSPRLGASGQEAQRRIAFLLRTLFRVTCSPARPIVLFLDDLHWADEASLQLLRTLLTDAQVSGLLFVGCFRDNEVLAAPGHPLTTLLDDVRGAESVSITTVHVGNMDSDSVHSLVSNSLRMVPRRTRSLSDEIVQKTGGNALFAVQLLSSLVDSGLLMFSLTSRQWEWDLEGIRARDIADNVVELMTAKLMQLPHDVHEALRIVAAFGAQCQEELLQILDRDQDLIPKLGEKSKDGFGGLLNLAVAEGLMARTGTLYRFSHDQIQRAAYLLIPESEKEAFHLRIGRCLWKWSTPDEIDGFLFVVVDQLQRGAGLVVDREEKINLARLHLRAGQKAFDMYAFLPSTVYLKAGIELLSEDDWNVHRELCLDLYSSCAEAEFILADFAMMREHLEQVLRWGTSLREKLRAYYTLVQSLGSQGNTSDAIDTSMKVLTNFGVMFPPNPTIADVKQDTIMTAKLLENKTEDALLQLETMQDSEMKEAMRFLNAMLLYAFMYKQLLYLPLVSNRIVRLSVNHGACRESTVGFATYAMVLCARGDFRGGYRFGRLTIAFLERFQAREFHSRVYCIVSGFVNSWIEPIQCCLPSLKRAMHVGLATGDTEYAMANAQIYLSTALNIGQTLGPLLEETEAYTKHMVEYRSGLTNTMKVTKQVILNLLGRSADPVSLSGENMDEPNVPESGDKVLNTFFFSMWLAYLFGRYDVAAEMAEKDKEEMLSSKRLPTRFILTCNRAFYKGLVALALARRTGESKWAVIAEEVIEKIKAWTELSEWNSLHKLELLYAEYAYLQGDYTAAAKSYEKAIELSAKHRFVHEQALALERAGIFYKENDDHLTSSGMFMKALECYRVWGSLAKVKFVQEHYLLTVIR